jgi:ATP-dependent Lon protease
MGFASEVAFAAIMTMRSMLRDEQKRNAHSNTSRTTTASAKAPEFISGITLAQEREKIENMFLEIVASSDKHVKSKAEFNPIEIIRIIFSAGLCYIIEPTGVKNTEKARMYDFAMRHLQNRNGYTGEKLHCSDENPIHMLYKLYDKSLDVLAICGTNAEGNPTLVDMVKSMANCFNNTVLVLLQKYPDDAFDKLFPIRFVDGMLAALRNPETQAREEESTLADQNYNSNLNEEVSFSIEATSAAIHRKLRTHFDGKIVRKDLTKKIREGANVPVYVLEYLLGQYCNSDDEEIIAQGMGNVKRILADNFVRPDEAQKILSALRERGSYTVIDKLTVHLNIKEDRYEAEFSNLGLRGVPLSSDYVSKYDRLLCGGIWCIVQLEYEFIEEDKRRTPVIIRKVTPIQMPHVDMDEIKSGRKAFTKEEWVSILLRSTGMESDKFTDREKWLLLARMIPLAENNYNLCELGPRSTGKSHIYKEISPNSILVSGGQTTVANLFYNMANKSVGLVGLWDCVAFDEVAGITFKDKDGVQIMKDYMASGSFARGKEEKSAAASMVFVGNINQSVDVLLKTSHLFEPFPSVMAYDTAFLDRMHCYVPGWEIPKFRPDFFTDDYGFITDFLSEFMREMRKETFGDALDRCFRLGSNLNQRDVIAVRKTVSGFIKLLYPDGIFTKEEIAEILEVALEMRRRVKEQLKKIGGMEFYDVNFSYIDNDSFEENYVSTPEQCGGKLIPEGISNPGQLYTVSRGKSGMIGVFRLEAQMLPGNGKFDRTGIGTDREAREATNTAFSFLKANGKTISGNISTTTKDYIINYQDLQGIGMTKYLGLPTLLAICSVALNKPLLSSIAVLGEVSIGGTLIKVEELANVLQICLDSGAKKVLLPIASAAEIGQVPSDLVGAFSLIFYTTAQEAVFKALGVD